MIHINLIKSIVIFTLSFFFWSCKTDSKMIKTDTTYKEYASFDWFKYQGKDDMFNHVKSENQYINPILSGFYPDPSICAANGKFYLTTSTFTYFPGLPIFESTDLIHWEQIGHAITRKEQVNFNGQRVSRGMFAPTIRFHEGTFYIICTNVSGDGNFIVTTKNPAGPWSNPIVIPDVNGIDPDIFFDEDGKTYITHNGPPPNNVSLHDGHRAIYMFEYDLEKQKIASESKLLVNGGTDMAKEPVWIEAPHLIKKGGFYYLICAEGGTAYHHSEVVFRSKNIDGPYQPYKNNPILTQRHLDKSRENAITTAGHADFVELPNGNWWAVFLACRPYKDNLYNTGRETFLMPVTWENDWPKITGGNNPIPIYSEKPNLPISNIKTEPTTGNFVSKDDFTHASLDLKWNFIRTPLEKWYELDGEYLHMKPREESIHTLTNFSFVGRRQQHLQFEASTKLTYTPTNNKQTAGLVAFQNETHYMLIGKRLNKHGETEVFLEVTSSTLNNKKPNCIAQAVIPKDKDLFLKIDGNKGRYSFYYKISETEEWQLLAKDIDATLLSTEIAKGFVGTYLAMYTSLNHF